jgi:hypothetical protein
MHGRLGVEGTLVDQLSATLPCRDQNGLEFSLPLYIFFFEYLFRIQIDVLSGPVVSFDGQLLSFVLHLTCAVTRRNRMVVFHVGTNSFEGARVLIFSDRL